MTERPPPTPADGGPRVDDVDEERLGQAMAALLGGSWPGSDEQGAGSGFTLPPPRQFEPDDEGWPPLVADPASPDAGIWDDPVPGEAPWAWAETPEPVEAWAGPSDGPVLDGPPAPEVAAAEGAAAEPAEADPWASFDEPTQAHTWSSVDEEPQASEPALVDPPAASGAASSFDDWSWGADEPAVASSGPEPDDQAALEHAGLAGPMNTALSDLRRVGGTDADVTKVAAGVPAAAGGRGGSGTLAELQDWWSGRGRGLLPGLAVAAVVVLAFAVVLLGGGSDSDGSKVNTGAVPKVTVTTPTSLPEESVASEPLFGDTLGDPLFSEPLPDAGSGAGTAAVNKPSPNPPTRRPARGPAAGPTPPPPGGQPAGPAPTTPPTAPPRTTPTTQPPVTSTAPPPTTPDAGSQRCTLRPDLC